MPRKSKTKSQKTQVNPAATPQTLWDQTKELEGPLGPRLSGDPEVLCEVKGWTSADGGYPIAIPQIQELLMCVPHTFPEDFPPTPFTKLTPEQKTEAARIAQMCPELPLYDGTFSTVIQMAVSFRDRYAKRS